MNERDVLAYDPFGGDFGDQDDVLFSDKMVNARKEHKCFDCLGPIAKGERIRSRTEKVDGRVGTARWCCLCCEAMALSRRDEGRAAEARFALRREREAAAREAIDATTQHFHGSSREGVSTGNSNPVDTLLKREF